MRLMKQRKSLIAKLAKIKNTIKNNQIKLSLTVMVGLYICLDWLHEVD